MFPGILAVPTIPCILHDKVHNYIIKSTVEFTLYFTFVKLKKDAGWRMIQVGKLQLPDVKAVFDEEKLEQE